MIERRWTTKNAREVVGVDLFCGAGGATQGFLDAGATVALSVDAWETAGFLHKANYPHVPFVLRRLGEEPNEDLAIIVKALDRFRGKHIHIHGSPPCQAFSLLGKKNASDGMALVNHFIWLVDRLKELGLCDSWSMENVPQTRNYFPHLPHHMLKASDYGSPQARVRWFAGEGWVPKKVEGALSWNEALKDPTIPDGSVLNTTGSAWSNSHRAKASDSPWNAHCRTLTRQKACIRKENADGTFTKVRGLTVNEQATLFGFPDDLDWKVPTGEKDLFIALGNCVCPQVMTAVIHGLV